jgi:peptidoglycan/LPS O-acetylase OafA/YrhL
MTYINAWPVPVYLAILYAAASLPAFRFLDVPSEHRGRLATLDGLRGFLALAVFLCHAALYPAYIRENSWNASPVSFFSALGQTGVALFFMITGYLFWSRLLREHGRPDWARLYIGRLFRIGPLYLCAVGVMLPVVFRDTGWHRAVPIVQLTKELVKWLGLGFFYACNINGYDEPQFQLAGVTWTLRYEWYFYLSLPILALAARRRHLPTVLTVCCCLLLYVGLTQSPTGVASPACCALLFCLGMASASLVRAALLPRLPDSWASVAVLALLLAVLLYWRNATTAVPALLLGVCFLLIVSGTTLFGLLVSRPAVRLGDISYGLYLLHGLVLGAVFFGLGGHLPASLSPAQSGVMILLTGLLLVCVAACTHALIERPGIEAGRMCAASWPVQRMRLALGSSGRPQPDANPAPRSAEWEPPAHAST